MEKKKTPMPEQEPKERIKNFNEVALGYDEEDAVKEAGRCLACKKPVCVKGCPVEIDIPSFISFIKERKFDEAISKIKEKTLYQQFVEGYARRKPSVRSYVFQEKKVSLWQLEDLNALLQIGKEKRVLNPLRRLPLPEKK